MKNLLGLLFCVLAFVSNAANVSFSSFDPKYFSTNSLNIQGMIGTNAADGSLTNRNQSNGKVSVAGTNAVIVADSNIGKPLFDGRFLGTNSFLVWTNGGITVGPNTADYWGSYAGQYGETLISTHNVGAGDPNHNEIDITTVGPGGTFGGMNALNTTNGSDLELLVSNPNAALKSDILLNAHADATEFKMTDRNTNWVDFLPDQTASTIGPSFLFNTKYLMTNTATTSPLLAMRNANVNKFLIMPNGDLYWGANATVGYQAPAGHGAANSVLTDTNGSGALSWQPASAGGQTNWPVSAITNAGTAAYSNATAFALAQSGTIVTQNNSFALVVSNTVKMDAAHALSLSNLTASRIVLSGADNGLGSAAASGAVPVNADGSASTFAQINALAPGFVMTNNNVNSFVIFTNNQVSINMSSSGVFTFTNYAAAGLGFSWSTNGTTTMSQVVLPSQVWITTSGDSKQKFFLASSGATTIKSGGTSSGGADIAFRTADDVTHFGMDQDKSTFYQYVISTNGFAMPTNFTAAAFTPVVGYVKIASSNGVLYKITQLSTNLLNSLVP